MRQAHSTKRTTKGAQMSCRAYLGYLIAGVVLTSLMALDVFFVMAAAR